MYKKNTYNAYTLVDRCTTACCESHEIRSDSFDCFDC